MSLLTTAVEAKAMLFVAVVVNVPSGITQKLVPPTAVAFMPTGIPQAVIAFVPVIWNSGPLGVVVPATEATAVVTAGEKSVFWNPGTHVFVIVEHNH